MKNWEKEQIAKELKHKLVRTKRSHKRYEKKLAKKHTDELDYIRHRLNGVSETLLKSDCKTAEQASRILNQLLTLIPETVLTLQIDKQLTVEGNNWRFQHDLVNEIKAVEEKIDNYHDSKGSA